MHAEIVITGARGAMGYALREWLTGVNVVYLGREMCDVTREDNVRSTLSLLRPQIVVHAAALTHHAANASALIETNVLGTQYIAEWCASANARMVYLSTHYVYGGEAPMWGYTERDDVKPVGLYAWSKLAGEGWVRTVSDHCVIRGSWYTPAKVAQWATSGIICDAWHTREPIKWAARKIALLATHGAQGTFNIGGERRTFGDVVHKEASLLVRAYARDRTRAEITCDYPFPYDASVSTRKFDAWSAAHTALA